ncbi:hypothetical protein T265_10947 [Opisthorchis viverrini]|uniref:Uncharacterized protein n=1 Tax=Opisthorchis viverrini TaxID=6198 RepID=A0A074Z4R1_OPIVI|nr:hypothetical protein T265_10947 [Opisthorchis viverrini]KER20517.1 hypothetical protein T265_10947 [Opisthorchis viverrini]
MCKNQMNDPIFMIPLGLLIDVSVTSELNQCSRGSHAFIGRRNSSFEKNRSSTAPFRCLTAMQTEGNTRAWILPGCPGLDISSQNAEVWFSSWTFRYRFHLKAALSYPLPIPSQQLLPNFSKNQHLVSHAIHGTFAGKIYSRLSLPTKMMRGNPIYWFENSEPSSTVDS